MKTGKVAIVGKPNVGKSTLVNTIFNKNMVITSCKPQTTRNKISLFYQDKEAQIIITDTPGYHKAKNKLDLFLNSQVKTSLKDVDVVIFVFDAKRNYDDEDKKILEQIKTFKFNKLVLAINKFEGENELVLKSIKSVLENDGFIFDKIMCISALYNEHIVELMDYVKSQLEESDDQFFIENNVEQKDEFLIAEIIRRIIIEKFKQEIPYSVAVVVEKMQFFQDKNLLSINFSIVVEKESQKPIIIGKNGKVIKEIGIEARKELLKIYDCKIFLESHVKVKKNWRDNDTMIKELGYKK